MIEIPRLALIRLVAPPARRRKGRRNEDPRRSVVPLIRLDRATLWIGAQSRRLSWQDARCLAETIERCTMGKCVQVMTRLGWVFREVVRERVYELDAAGFQRVRITKAQAQFLGAQLTRFPRVIEGKAGSE